MSSYFSTNNNFFFSRLRENDLKELLLELDNYLLEYRDTLGLDSNVRFGVEIEYENLDEEYADHFIHTHQNLNKWLSTTDGTVRSGGEIKSPILIDSKENWDNLKMICNFLKDKGAQTLDSAGGHIHVGAHLLGDDIDAWDRFLKLYAIYENVLFRFFYGDKIGPREAAIRYAPSFGKEIIHYYHSNDRFKSLRSIVNISSGRYSALNLRNIIIDDIMNKKEKNTIEFRRPNGTIEEVIWQNNVNASTKMILAAKDDVIDMDFIDHKIKKFQSYSKNRYLYDDVCLRNLFEFVDIIFDNNLDKVYFVKQYLKDFETDFSSDELHKAKVFYK